MNSANHLAHYGVKGMKWGIRRTPQQLGHDTMVLNKASKMAGDAKNAVQEIDKIRKLSHKSDTSIKSMSDDELRRRINRLNMERQYSQLTQPETSKGASYVSSVHGVAGSLLAIGASATTILLGIQKLKG